MQDVLFSQQGVFGIITLNRPKALNALTTDMCLAMSSELTRWQNTKEIAGVMIKGSGDRAFCAGGDIRFLYQAHQENKVSLSDQFVYHEYHLNRQIAEYPKPYIALQNGLTMGGGAGVSVHGKRRIASEKVIWAMPETAIGLFPDIGASYFLSRCGAFGTYLALTGARINADILKNIGLIDAVVPSNDIDALEKSLCELDASDNMLKDIDACIAKVSKSIGMQDHPQQKLIDSCFGHHSIEAILEALQAFNDEPFAKQTYQELLQRSPTSLKITLAALQRGAAYNLPECLAQEYRLVYRCLREPDLYEGIRAAVIDKDQSPTWCPAKLTDVSAAVVESYFASPVDLWRR